MRIPLVKILGNDNFCRWEIKLTILYKGRISVKRIHVYGYVITHLDQDFINTILYIYITDLCALIPDKKTVIYEHKR